MSDYHTSVLLTEVIEYLRVKPGGRYIDGTFGGGGHTEAILQRDGRVLGIDHDEDAIAFGKEKFKIQNSKFKNNLELVRGNFSEIKTIAKGYGFTDVDGVLFDLGVSGYQFDEATRGFSLKQMGPLDMRMDKRLGVTAADLVNGLPEKKLTELFYRYGEEPNARYLARVITERRKSTPFTDTKDLADTIKTRTRFGYGKIHPATRIFQALRIAVNDEIHVLENALPEAFTLLKPGGRIVAISFHSLEDRVVKQTFLGLEGSGSARIITKKPVVPTGGEIQRNSRSRSAKLRSIEKL